MDKRLSQTVLFVPTKSSYIFSYISPLTLFVLIFASPNIRIFGELTKIAKFKTREEKPLA